MEGPFRLVHFVGRPRSPLHVRKTSVSTIQLYSRREDFILRIKYIYKKPTEETRVCNRIHETHTVIISQYRSRKGFHVGVLGHCRKEDLGVLPVGDYTVLTYLFTHLISSKTLGLCLYSYR